jgi:hypothetical protein
MTAYSLIVVSGQRLEPLVVVDALDSVLEAGRADLLRTVAEKWGILADDITEAEAMTCQRRLHAPCLESVVRPANQIVDPPEPQSASAARVDPLGFAWKARGDLVLTEWNEVAYVDLLQIDESKHVLYEDSEAHDEGRSKTVRRPGIVTKPGFVLVIGTTTPTTHTPVTQIRIRSDKFSFESTGLKLEPSGLANLKRLAYEVARHAPTALVGTSVPRTPDAPSKPEVCRTERIATARIRWKLTRAIRRL